MRVSYSSLISLFISSYVVGLIALTGCAPKDQKLGDSSGGSGQVSATGIENRDLALSRHLLTQLAELRRAVQTAVATQMGTRVMGLSGQKTMLTPGGCRSLIKMAAASDLNIAVYSESFQIGFASCQDVSDEVSSGEKFGPEYYHLSYSKPFPKKDDADQNVGLPTSIGVEERNVGHTLKMKTSPKGYDQIKVYRSTTLNADLVADDADSVTYRAFYSVRDTFDFNVVKTLRAGRTDATISDVLVQVSKNDDPSLRRVLSLSFAPTAKMNLQINGTQYTKDDLNTKYAKLSDLQYINVKDFALSAQGEITLPNDVCILPQGIFALNKQNSLKPTTPANTAPTDAGTVTSSGDKVSLTSAGGGAPGEPLTTKICDGPDEHPVFSDVIEKLYF